MEFILNLVLDKSKLFANTILFLISLKLIISPWSVGDYQLHAVLILNYFLDSAILLSVIFGAIGSKVGYSFIYKSAIFSGLIYIISTLIYTKASFLDAISAHLKIYLPLLVFPVLLKQLQFDSKGFIGNVKLFSFMTIILIFIGFIFLPVSYNRMVAWLPSYFGGLHSTSYVALMLGFVIYALLLYDEIKPKYAFLLISALSLLIFFGWGVRTATLAMLIFILGLSIDYIRFGDKPILKHVFLFFAAVFFVLIFYFGISDEIDNFSSGRISMYKDKYAQLMSNDFLNWLIGNGAGSDLIETDVWWWAAKGSHSDLITMIVEAGIIYLGVFLWTIFRVSASQNWQTKCMLAAVLVTSTVSNGIFVRPIAGYIFAIVLVMFVGYELYKKRSFYM